MREEHTIERRGKKYILYAGLLAEFHELLPDLPHSIDSVLMQTPLAENGNVAIVRAVVAILDADGETIVKRNTGIGDASPENVDQPKQKRLIAMAETRAKARALRDLVNAGELPFADDEPTEEREEVDIEGMRGRAQTIPRDQHEAERRRAEKRQTGEVASHADRADGEGESLAKKSQVELLKTLAVEWRGEGGVERLEDRIGHPLEELTRRQADDWIDRLTPEHRQ